MKNQCSFWYVLKITFDSVINLLIGLKINFKGVLDDDLNVTCQTWNFFMLNVKKYMIKSSIFLFLIYSICAVERLNSTKPPEPLATYRPKPGGWGGSDWSPFHQRFYFHLQNILTSVTHPATERLSMCCQLYASMSLCLSLSVLHSVMLISVGNSRPTEFRVWIS